MSKEKDAKREALALELSRKFALTYSAGPIADYILALQAEREGPLVRAVEGAVAELGTGHTRSRLMAALARHRALDAPPTPTPKPLEVFGIKVVLADGVERPIMFTEEGLREAFKREEGKR